MKKTLLVVGLFLVVCAVALYFVLEYTNSIKEDNISPTLVNPTIQIKTTTKTASEEDSNLNYEITANYPAFSGLVDATAQDKINQGIKNFVAGEIEDFKKYASENCNFSDLPNPPVWGCEMIITSNGFNLAKESILSVRMEDYRFTGGAHGGTTYTFLNYDINTGEKIDWKSIFMGDSQYLQKIADYSMTDLKKQLLKPDESSTDEGWIVRGTEPIDENYNTNVGYDKNGLFIIFQQYQVAAYAAGPQQVIIPFAELQGFLK